MNSRTTPNLIRSCPLFTVHLGCDLLASVVACILWLWITSAQPMCAGTIEGAGPWHYGWTHGLEKISRDRSERLFHSQPGATLRVELAGNEYEGVQLVLRSAKLLRNVAVRVSDLTTDNGGRLGSEPVEVLPVGYVNTRKRGNKVWWYVCTGSGHPYANFFIEYVRGRAPSVDGLHAAQVSLGGVSVLVHELLGLHVPGSQRDGQDNLADNAVPRADRPRPADQCRRQ